MTQTSHDNQCLDLEFVTHNGRGDLDGPALSLHNERLSPNPWMEHRPGENRRNIAGGRP
jgi:hypothetical protein